MNFLSKSNIHIFNIITSFSAILFYFLLKIKSPNFENIPLLISIIVCGIPAIFSIIVKFFKGNWGADTLAAITIVSAFLMDQYLAAVIIILMLSSGQILEIFAMKKASSVLMALAQRIPSIAHKKVGDAIQEIPIKEIKINDEIIIFPHETSPVDGVVIDGYGNMDESFLTGEPYHIAKAPGSFIISGAINGETPIIIKATKLPSDSRYASIVSVLTEAEQKKPSIRRLGDKIGAIFSPIIIIIAILVGYITGDPIRSLAILVIATPCPLIIAIPIALISAISIAAKHSIIIKDPAILEQIPTCKTAIFDKTGTLTYGKPILTNIITDKNSDAVLADVASLERYSKHPLASAILHAAKEKNIGLKKVEHISEVPGQGLNGVIDQNHYQITSRKKAIYSNSTLETKLPDITAGLECIVLCDNEYIATLQFKDIPRDESQSFINHLSPKHQFEKVMLVSGDRPSEVNYLGKLLEFTHVYSQQTPEQKLSIVLAEREKAPTLFMGDGINDAPAIAAATVGIAFGQNSNITSEAADAVMLESTLIKVDQLIHLSILTRKITLQSAVGGMVLSIIGVVFAGAGYISPVFGAVLQEIIDVIAIISALRLLFQKKIETDLK